MADFDTPPSSTAYDVAVTGTVAGWASAHVMIKLNVTNTGTANLARNVTLQSAFYRAKNYSNTATSTASHVSETLRLAITPMLHGSETVTTVVNFGY